MKRSTNTRGYFSGFFMLLLLATNLLLISLVCLHAWRSPPAPPVIRVVPCEHPAAQPAVAPDIHVDTREISGSLDSIRRSLEILSANVERMNVTGVQYAYLTRETERLERAAELVTMRIQSLEEARAKGRSGGDPASIGKLKEIKAKLNQETGERNQLIKQLVQKMEGHFVGGTPDAGKPATLVPPAESSGAPQPITSGAADEGRRANPLPQPAPVK